MNIYLDIETIPKQPEQAVKELIAAEVEAPKTMSKPETIQAWHDGEGKYKGEKDRIIEERYRSTALDGTHGEIISIAFQCDDLVFSKYRDLDEPEADLLASFCKSITLHSNMRPPFFIGHNIQFDLRFLFQRLVINQVRPSFRLPFSGRHDNHFFCTMQAWAGFGGKISQEKLCTALGIKGKPDDIDGSKVWDFVKSGNIKRVNEYNQFDVERVRMMHQRLAFITQKNDKAVA